MEVLKPPKQINLDSSQNLSEIWRKWKAAFTIYLQATEADAKTDVVKSSILLHCIGPQAKEIYDTFQFAEGEAMRYNTVIAKFDEHFNPRKNLTFNRYNFLTARQRDNETFDEFYTRLRKLSQDCELNDLRDSLLKDLIIIGIRDKKLRERFLRENEINLEAVLRNGRASEASKKQSTELNKINNETANAEIHHINERRSTPTGQHRQLGNRNRQQNQQKEVIFKCKFCSGTHQRGSCPAFEKTCNKCNKKGHYSKCCKSKSKSYQPKGVGAVDCNNDNTQRTDELDVSSDDSSDEFFVGALDESDEETDWLVKLDTNSTSITYKLDTGAKANVISLDEYYKIKPRPTLHKTKAKLTAYNQTRIKVEGRCIVNLQYKSKVYPTLFYVAHTQSIPVLGLKSCIRLNLVKRIDNISTSTFVEEYSDCFGELGTVNKTYHIVLDPTVPPVINACRRVPIALQPRLKEELLRMEELKIIKPVTEPTDWVSSLVIVNKPNGKLRICLDPRNLNKAIRRHHHKMPTTEEILSRMSGAQYFTKLDASNAYWQIPIDEESSHLLTFNTPFGRYRFLRMPYGIHSASEICQAHIASIIEHIPGAENCQDDIIIWGSTLEELHKRTHLCLQAIRQSGLKLRKQKCQFDMNSLTFLGHYISAEGIQPDNQKVSAITNFPTPTNVKELQRFLGMVTYLGKFIPNLSKETAPLRILLEKDIEWFIDKPQLQAIENLKKLITSSPTLKFFDVNRQSRITCDASQEGLGAVIEQFYADNWYPIAFASRSLTSAESNYCPLERETLAIVFACERFHEYIYGKTFTVVSDHLPLKSIFSKPLAKSPARLQRFRLRLQQYDFTVEYQQGKFMYVADALSRAPHDKPTPEIPEDELNAFVHIIADNLPISENRLHQFQVETKADQTLQSLRQQIEIGWPSSPKKLLHESLSPFYSYRDELAFQDGIIIKGHRIVVPTSLRQEMTKLLHIGHPGILTIKDRARESLFWPGINTHLEQSVTSCEACQQYRNKQPKEPQLHHEIPDTPWTKLATDVFHIKEKHFVILVDYTTKYFDLSQIDNVQSKTVTNQTKAMLSRYGIPKEIISDGGPEYMGSEYVNFCKSWDIKHTYSSPEYHESNGLAERTIQTVKRALKKSIKKKEDLQLAILALKASKSTVTGCAPTTMFFNRTIRTLVPSINDNRRTTKSSKKTIDGRKTLPKLQPGDNVRFHDGNSWSRRAKVVKEAPEPRSYFIKTDKQTTVRRNRRHLLKTNEKFDLDDSSDQESLLRENTHFEDQPTNTNELSNEHMQQTRSGRTVRKPNRFEHEYFRY